MSAPLSAYSLWAAPSPLWAGAWQDPDLQRFRQPVLFRFASPDQLKQALQPAGLAWTGQAPLVVAPETRKSPAVGWVAYEAYAAGLDKLMLYLATQSRFYMTAVSLTTALSGLPDRQSSDLAKGVKASYGFALRLLAPLPPARKVRPSDPGSYLEFAQVPSPANDGSTVWQPVGEAALVDGEDLLPCFGRPVQGAPGAGRQILTGVPAISPPGSEAIVVPGQLTALDLFLSARLADFQAAVLEPLGRLETATSPSEVQGLTGWVMLSLVDYLIRWLPSVWQQIQAWAKAPGASSGDLIWPWQEAAEALVSVWNQRPDILAGTQTVPYDLTHWLSPEAVSDMTAYVQKALGDLARARGILPKPITRKESTSDDYYCLRPVCTLTQGQQSEVQVGPPSRPFRMSSGYNLSAPKRSR